MKELDDNLFNLLAGDFNSERSPNDLKARIPQIKQAFADAGYVHIPQAEIEIVKGVEIMSINNKPVMTGQEWYTKFELELQSKTFRFIHSYDEVGTMLMIVQNAAKRAAGLIETKEDET